MQINTLDANTGSLGELLRLIHQLHLTEQSMSESAK